MRAAVILNPKTHIEKKKAASLSPSTGNTGEGESFLSLFKELDPGRHSVLPSGFHNGKKTGNVDTMGIVKIA